MFPPPQVPVGSWRSGQRARPRQEIRIAGSGKKEPCRIEVECGCSNLLKSLVVLANPWLYEREYISYLFVRGLHRDLVRSSPSQAARHSIFRPSFFDRAMDLQNPLNSS